MLICLNNFWRKTKSLYSIILYSGYVEMFSVEWLLTSELTVFHWKCKDITRGTCQLNIFLKNTQRCSPTECDCSLLYLNQIRERGFHDTKWRFGQDRQQNWSNQSQPRIEAVSKNRPFAMWNTIVRLDKMFDLESKSCWRLILIMSVTWIQQTH